MTIYLPEDLEDSPRAEVSRGRSASLDEAAAEAARLLLQQPHPLRGATADTGAFDDGDGPKGRFFGHGRILARGVGRINGPFPPLEGKPGCSRLEAGTDDPEAGR